MNIAITGYSLVGPGYRLIPAGKMTAQKAYRESLVRIFREGSDELFSTKTIGTKKLTISEIAVRSNEISPEILPRFVKIGDLAFLGLGDIEQLRTKGTGYIISSSKGGLDILSEAVHSPDIWKDNSRLFNYCHTDGLLNHLRDKYDLSGPMKCNVNACSTGLDAIIQATRWLMDGVCERVVVGVSETNLIDVILAGFANMGVTADGVSVPFSRGRNGFIPSEGAAFIMLEKTDDPTYPQVMGWGQVNDAYHPTSFSADNYSIAISMQQALTQAGLKPENIGFIKAHGTATILNDRIESENIERVFGRNTPISSYKSAFGHLLGTSGIFELVTMLILHEERLVPVTMGLTPDNLDKTLPQLKYFHDISVPRYSILNAFGFGGSISSLIVGHPAN